LSGRAFSPEPEPLTGRVLPPEPEPLPKRAFPPEPEPLPGRVWPPEPEPEPGRAWPPEPKPWVGPERLVFLGFLLTHLPFTIFSLLKREPEMELLNLEPELDELELELEDFFLVLGSCSGKTSLQYKGIPGLNHKILVYS
jgi:hypothetical protein